MKFEMNKIYVQGGFFCMGVGGMLTIFLLGGTEKGGGGLKNILPNIH